MDISVYSEYMNWCIPTVALQKGGHISDLYSSCLYLSRESFMAFVLFFKRRGLQKVIQNGSSVLIIWFLKLTNIGFMHG